MSRQGAGVGRDRAEPGGAAAEVAEGEVLGAGQGGPAVRGEPSARLQRDLEQHAERHLFASVLPEVPDVRRHVVLRLAPRPGLEHERLAADRGDAVEELERRPRQPGDDAVAVEDAVRLAESLRRVPVGEGEDAGAVVERRASVGA